jgi:hypothetical protein
MISKHSWSPHCAMYVQRANCVTMLAEARLDGVDMMSNQGQASEGAKGTEADMSHPVEI